MKATEPAMNLATREPVRRVLAALAIECATTTGDARVALPQAGAGALAARVARDLATHAPDAAALDCALVAAHFDPVELLRPGWPLHATLADYAARAPRDGDAAARVVAFGSHDDRLPEGLAPEPDFIGGPLRLLPVVLSGDAAVVASVGDRFEQVLMEEGMAAADTALAVQEAFGLRVEHARYLTLHDLCAMTALQYGHAGLEPLWPLLETALLSPAREAWLDAPPEPPVHYADGEARIALMSPVAWRDRFAATESDPDRLARGHAMFEARQRQFVAVLRAHAVPVTFVDCPGDPHAAL